MDDLSLLGYAVAFVGVTLALARSREQLRRLALLALTLGLAGLAQWRMLDGVFLQGGVLYGAAGASLLLLWYHRRIDVESLAADGAALSRRHELVAVAVVFGLTAVFRLWRFGNFPYGIEQDEGLWNWEIAHRFFGHLRPGTTSYHFTSFPVGFLEGALFQRLFGIDMLSAKIEIAFFNLLASLLFYLLVRRLFGPRVALIATFLLAISAVDVAAGRVAVFEARVKFWVILSYLLFVWALQTRELGTYLLAGVTLAAGMLVYQTFFLVPFVAGTTLVLVALREPERWRQNAAALLALVGPSAIVGPKVWNFTQAQRGFTESGWNDFIAHHPYDGAIEKFLRMWQFAGANLGDVVHSLFYQQRWADFLIVRLDGPIVLAAVVPLFILGLIIALLHARKVEYTFVLLWLLIGSFVGPLSTGVNLVRVMYPGLPAVYVLAAIGALCFLDAIRRELAPARAQLHAGALGLLGVLLVAVSWQVYFHETEDPEDRQQRREMLDLVSDATRLSDLIYIPYVPAQDDAIDREVEGVRFAVGGRWGMDNAQQHFRYVTYDQLLAAVSGHTSGSPAVVVYSKTPVAFHEDRLAALATLERCYPDFQVRAGKYFDLITIEPAGAGSGSCYSIGAISPVTPADGSAVDAGAPLAFKWRGAEGTQASFRLVLERIVDNTQLLEAEDVFSGTGWHEDSAAGRDYSGRGFVVDEPGAGRAEGTVPLQDAGDYYLWLRVNQRDATDGQSTLTVNRERLPIVVDPDTYGQWVWLPFGPLTLPAGRVALGLERTYGQQDVGLFVDAVVVTRNPAPNPTFESVWQGELDTGEIASAETAYTLSSSTTPLRPGHYRWRVQVFDGARLVDAIGRRGVWSDYAEFTVTGASPSQ